QLVIEPTKRGKFFAFSSSISAGLTPLGMALGGIISDNFAIPYVMLVFNLITLAVFLGVMAISAKTRAMFHIESEAPQP
ncbi:MAG TPA: hypothetical protein P5315_11945, partial [Clostridia bacterium]|nr:hypothetical protein [Clostridia bacterium]